MTRLSVNVNKIALLRNSRGGNIPDLVDFALRCEAYGAQGITIHPRPDQRHIRYDDVPALKKVVTTEFNIEGNPIPEFIQLVMDNKPDQVTLVPDSPDQLTSDHGWDTIKHRDFLKGVIKEFQQEGIRVSLFIDPIEAMLKGARDVGTDRIEFYTGPFAHDFNTDPEQAIAAFREAATICNTLGLGINAGHDLNLDNLAFFKQQVPGLLEVSIGHALVRDALFYGIESTIKQYLQCLVR